MRKLSYLEALVYYDGVQVFLGQDQFGARYVCTLVEQSDLRDTYLCAPVAATMLPSLLQGELDLKQVYTNTETKELLTIESVSGELEDLDSNPLTVTEVPDAWLPQSGFYIRHRMANDNVVVNEAVVRGRAVMRCRLNPPEAAFESKISAENLSQAARLVQRLVKYAFRRSIRDFDKSLRERLLPIENYQLEIFAFSPGSFTLHMQSAAPADLVGYSQIAKAFETIDRMSSVADSPRATVEQVSQLGGHVATTYRDLLRFISETKTQFEYAWASPDRDTSVMHSISSSEAKPLLDALAERADIGVERVELIGYLTKVDETQGTWRLTNEADGKVYGGSSEVDLAGLVIKTQRYKIDCEERLEEERGTGREFTKLYLKTWQTLQ